MNQFLTVHAFHKRKAWGLTHINTEVVSFLECTLQVQHGGYFWRIKVRKLWMQFLKWYHEDSLDCSFHNEHSHKTLAGTPAWQLIPNISLMLEGSSHSRGPYEMSTSQGTAIYDDAPLRGFLSLITREYPSQQVLITKTTAGFGF